MAVNRSIKLTESEWHSLKTRLAGDYPSSVMLIREKMRRVLGFTVREHTEYYNGRPLTIMHLDFFEESKKTMFLLKYSDYISKQENFSIELKQQYMSLGSRRSKKRRKHR